MGEIRENQDAKPAGPHDACTPRLAPGVRMQVDRFTGRHILLYPEAMAELTGPGPAVVALCDGRRTLREIVTHLAEQFSAPPEVLHADVSRYLERLVEKRLISLDDQGEPTASVEIAITQAKSDPSATGSPMLTRPIGLIAEVTYQCPLHCPYCSNPTRYPAGEELSTAEWCRVLEEAAAAGVLHALFSGGEPLARPDLEALITAARKAGLYTNLITSALGLTPARAAALRAAGLDSIQISFQSDEAPLANLIAGAQAHQRKLEAARLARQCGFPLTMNVVLHRHNIDRIDQIIALAQQLGARRLELANTQFYGWALRNRAALLPTRDQIQRAQAIAAAARDRLKGAIDVLYVLPDYFSDYPKPCMNGWGKRYLAVNPVGDVLPCPTASEIPGLSFDNVRRHDLQWIWEHSEAFNRFRGTAWMPEPCKSCDRREIDFGGCRCQAAILTGDASNTDPVCIRSPRRQVIFEALGERDGKPAPPLTTLQFRQGPLRG